MSDLHKTASPDEPPAWLEISDEDRGHIQEALAGLWQSWPVFAELAAAPDPDVREGARFVQTMLLGFAGDTAPPGFVAGARQALIPHWIESLAQAVAEREQVNLLFALARVAPDDPQVMEALQHTLKQTPSSLVGYVAALKLVDLTGNVDDRGVDFLLDAHHESDAIYEQLRHGPRWDEYWVVGQLEALGPAVIERRLSRFLDMVRFPGSRPGASARIRAVMRLAFGGQKLPPGASARDLTAAQHQLLQAAVDNGHYWSRTWNHCLQLDQLLGVPEDRRDLRAFLAGPGEPVTAPRNDPEEALVQFNHLVREQLRLEFGINPYHREPGDTRAPFRMIQESIAEMDRVTAGYRPSDRARITETGSPTPAWCIRPG
jgi:hypothetical protein